MEFTLTDILNNAGLVGGAFLVGVSFAMLFWKADEALSEHFKLDLAIYLACKELPKGKSISNFFLSTFDWWFGSSLFSWRCFARSCVASSVSVAIATLIYIAIFPERISGPSAFLLFIGVFVFGLILNLVPDYVSLVQSRLLLGKLSHSPSSSNALLIALLDFAMTMLIVVAALTIFDLVWSAIVTLFLTNIDIDQPFAVGRIFRWPSRIIKSMTLYWSDDLSLSSFLGIFCYSTLFTSLWLWGYSAGIVVTRLAPLRDRLVYVLPVEKFPMRSVGIVAGLLSGTAFLLLVAVFGQLDTQMLLDVTGDNDPFDHITVDIVSF